MEPSTSNSRLIAMRRLSALVAVVMLVSACASQPGDLAATGSTAFVQESTTTPTEAPDPMGPPGADAGLEAARAKWDAAGLDTYTYEFFDDCGECEQLPARAVVVWDGEVMDVLGRAQSVEDAFALIEEGLLQGSAVEVEYDPELGYPIDLWIDRDARAYDGGVHLTFEEVRSGLPGQPMSVDSLRKARARWEAAAVDAYDFTFSIVCDCELQAVVDARVVDGVVKRFEPHTPEETNVTFSPFTLDRLFVDLEEMIAGQHDDGVLVTGSALYHEQLGYPTWVGLDLEVTDNEAVGGISIPPRLVIAVSELEQLSPDPVSELEEAMARWSSAALDSYTFDIVFHTVEAATFTDTFTVRVQDGVIVSVTENGYEYTPDEVELPIIDDLFDAIADLQFAGYPVDVIYDAELGYPAVVITDEPGTSVSISLHR